MLVFCLCFENSFGCREDMEIWISNINSTFGKLTLYKYRSDVSPAVEQSLKMEKVQLSLYLFVGMSLRGFLVALQFCIYTKLGNAPARGCIYECINRCRKILGEQSATI